MQARTHFCYIQESVYVGRKCISSKPVNAALQKTEKLLKLEIKPVYFDERNG